MSGKHSRNHSSRYIENKLMRDQKKLELKQNIKEYTLRYNELKQEFPDCVEWVQCALQEITSGNAKDISDHIYDKFSHSFGKEHVNLVLYSNQGECFEKSSEKSSEGHPVWLLKFKNSDGPSKKFLDIYNKLVEPKPAEVETKPNKVYFVYVDYDLFPDEYMKIIAENKDLKNQYFIYTYTKDKNNIIPTNRASRFRFAPPCITPSISVDITFHIMSNMGQCYAIVDYVLLINNDDPGITRLEELLAYNNITLKRAKDTEDVLAFLK